MTRDVEFIDWRSFRRIPGVREAIVYVCVCVCVCEREREREREKDVVELKWEDRAVLKSSKRRGQVRFVRYMIQIQNPAIF